MVKVLAPRMVLMLPLMVLLILSAVSATKEILPGFSRFSGKSTKCLYIFSYVKHSPSDAYMFKETWISHGCSYVYDPELYFPDYIEEVVQPSCVNNWFMRFIKSDSIISFYMVRLMQYSSPASILASSILRAQLIYSFAILIIKLITEVLSIWYLLVLCGYIRIEVKRDETCNVTYVSRRLNLSFSVALDCHYAQVPLNRREILHIMLNTAHHQFSGLRSFLFWDPGGLFYNFFYANNFVSRNSLFSLRFGINSSDNGFRSFKTRKVLVSLCRIILWPYVMLFSYHGFFLTALCVSVLLSKNL